MNKQNHRSWKLKELLLYTDYLKNYEYYRGRIDNEIDQDKLEDWCENVRHLAKLHHRQEITDRVIGKILHMPLIAQ